MTAPSSTLRSEAAERAELERRVLRRRQGWRALRALLGVALVALGVFRLSDGDSALFALWIVWGLTVVWSARQLGDPEPPEPVRCSVEYAAQVRARATAEGYAAAVRHVQHLSAVGLANAMATVDEVLAAAPPAPEAQAAAATGADASASGSDARLRKVVQP